MRRKSSNLKNLSGTARPDRAASGVVSPGIPEKPVFADMVAATTWDALTAELSAAGMLSRLDASILETACLIFSRIRVVAESLRLEGETVIDANGNSKLNPLAKCLKDYCSTFDTLCNSLALTPTSRSKIGLSLKCETSDPLTEFLKKGGAK